MSGSTTPGFPINISNFSAASSNTGSFVLGGSASIAGAALQLTPNSPLQEGIAVYSDPVPSGNTLNISFTYDSTGSTTGGGDGLSFFLLNGDELTGGAASVTPGAVGGGLGYASGVANGQPGVPDAYLGVGFDTFGDFSASSVGSGGPGNEPNSVVTRGSGDGSSTVNNYAYLSGAAYAPGINGARDVELDLTKISATQEQLQVFIRPSGTGTYTLVTNEVINQPLPTQFYLGFAASTGEATDLHSITNLTATSTIPGLLPFADLSVTGASATQVVTVTATLPTGTAGSYSNLGTGSVSGLAYTVTGTAAAVNTALQTVQFTPTGAVSLPAVYTAALAGGNATTTISDSATDTAVLVSGAGNNVINSTGTDTVDAGSGSDTVFASGTLASVAGGTGNLVFVAGNGNYVAGGGGGSDTLYGGNGADTLTGGSGANSIIVAGFGNTSLSGGGGNSALMFGGQASSTFTGSGGGNDTLVGGNGANVFNMTGGDIAFGGANGPDTFNSGTGSALVVEGAGATTVNLGGGSLTAFDGTAADNYTASQALGGSVEIVGFKAADHLTLTGGFTQADVSAALSSATTNAAGTALTLSNGTNIELFGASITAGQVSAA